ncbi:MAG: hypothetical protein HY747_06750 [Elusimicrobia bacterium]|nr:hypothetical protein [Elusimicrobiota bacterium]
MKAGIKGSRDQGIRDRRIWKFFFPLFPYSLIPLFPLFLAFPVLASERAGTYAGTFLLAPTGVRSMGMGDAGAAVASGSNGAQYNPATLARTNSADACFSRQNLLTDASMNFAGYAQPLDFQGLSELGGAARFSTLRYVDQGKIEANILKADGSFEK